MVQTRQLNRRPRQEYRAAVGRGQRLQHPLTYNGEMEYVVVLLFTPTVTLDEIVENIYFTASNNSAVTRTCCPDLRMTNCATCAAVSARHQTPEWWYKQFESKT
jgi:hypothetical protein